MRIVALMTVRNEEMYIERCIRHLVDQGIEIYLLNNESTDRTLEIASRYLNKGIIYIEHFPYNGKFEWKRILGNIEKLSKIIDADWFILQAADEILESPEAGQSLSEAIEEIDQSGYNVINFDEFVFLPISEDEQFEGRDFVSEMKYYYFFEPTKKRLQRAWKKSSAINLHSSGGHNINFSGKNIYPQNFILRHYMILSKKHALEKYGNRRYSKDHIVNNWSEDRRMFPAEEFQLISKVHLKDVDYHGFDRTDPWKTHFFKNNRNGFSTSSQVNIIQRSIQRTKTGYDHNNGTKNLFKLHRLQESIESLIIEAKNEIENKVEDCIGIYQEFGFHKMVNALVKFIEHQHKYLKTLFSQDYILWFILTKLSETRKEREASIDMLSVVTNPKWEESISKHFVISANNYKLLGIKLLKTNEYIIARHFLKKAENYLESDADLYFYLAQAEQKLKNSYSAIIYIQRAIKINPKSNYYWHLGKLHKSSDNPKEAIFYFEKYTKHITNPHIFIALAQCYTLLNNTSQALYYFKLALGGLPKNLELYLETGNLLHKMKSYNEASVMFRKSLEIDAQNPRGFIGLSKALLKDKKAKEVIELLINPDSPSQDPKLLNCLGTAYLATGQYSKATDTFIKVHKLYPESSAYIGWSKSLFYRHNFTGSLRIFWWAIKHKFLGHG